MSDSRSHPRESYRRSCLFCGGEARVLLPPGADDLDVEAEFSATGRAFGDDNETVGVGCYRCSRLRWREEASRAA